MRTVCIRTATYMENMLGQTWYPGRSMKSREIQVCCANTAANERYFFLKWWKLSFFFFFQGSLLCFKQIDWSRIKLKTSHLFPWHGTYSVGHIKDMQKLGLSPLQLNTKSSRGYFLFWFERHPHLQNVLCSTQSTRQLAVKILGITKHLMCTQRLARNLQPWNWIF